MSVSPHRPTQHKRFVPYGTHSNFCFAKTSFMLETLDAISVLLLMFTIAKLNNWS